MIFAKDKKFLLNTDHSSYAFGVNEKGLLEHYHYGAKIPFVKEAGDDLFLALSEKVNHAKGTTVNYDKETFLVTEDMLLETSSYGKGDYRNPFLKLSYADGSRTSDFLYDSFYLNDTPEMTQTLPCSYGTSEQLVIVLKERVYPVTLKLYYTVYPACDVITRRAVLKNNGKDNVYIDRLMSLQLDLDTYGYKMVTFGGNWAREMHKTETVVEHGTFVNSSACGVSSNRNNPFVMLTEKDATETAGEAYGFHLVYSGNHYEACEVGGFYKTRFLMGLNPETFEWTLQPNESFETPEACMTFSFNGYRGISEHFHPFVREHIVRGNFKNTVRPVLLNSWEASYFDISESKLLKLASKAKEAGIELFVMDDGWFLGRNNDQSSLGDWSVDLKKLPGGLKRLSDKIHALGLQFGIWVEPEMVSENSDLFRAHPEYALTIPGRENSPGRNQMVLDLTNPDVVSFVKDAMRSVFSSAKIEYVKWDMNRMISDAFGKTLPAQRQGEVWHRYVLGLYDIVRTLTEEFPDILFEGCASGGNRFDLGMLCYMPQIWASDDTDAYERIIIQTGYSYGYPMSTLTSHVSACPNHQTLRTTPLNSRFSVAMYGLLGYELNLCELKAEEFEEVKKQIETYKAWREVLQFGDFYRMDDTTWITVSKDKGKAVAMTFNVLVEPNDFYRKLRVTGLSDDDYYHCYNVMLKHNLKEFGDLVNQVSSVHIKKDSLLHNTLAKFVKMDGEVEDYVVSGALLNNAGIKLKQAFGGTGYNNETRLFQDFYARVYYMERI